MTDLIIIKTDSLSGTVRAPPSKAFTHRAVIAASLSEGRSQIKDALVCDDTLATVKACSLLGSKINQDKGSLVIDGVSKPTTPTNIIHCRDSGSTIRFITPICALADGISILTGSKGLRRRPMEPLLTSLRQLGIRCYSTPDNGCPPIVVFGGNFKGGKTSIKGDVSSQFISGLLFSACRADTNVEMSLTTKLESKPYVAMTIEVLRDHGIKVERAADYSSFTIPHSQTYMPHNHTIEGDYSSAAFLLAAASITDSHTKITNLYKESNQGDRVIVDILKKMGSKVNAGKDFLETHGTKQGLKGIKINVQDTPDLAPVLAALACLAQGETTISGARRLRYKESDRITSLSNELRKMGGRIREHDDGLIIEGKSKLHGSEIDSHNDHRIAMACTILALRAEGKTTIHGIECINKSYPNFISDLTTLGAKIAN